VISLILGSLLTVAGAIIWAISASGLQQQLSVLGATCLFVGITLVMRGLTEEEFLRGKERLRRAVQHAEYTARAETRTNWLDLLVLR
jgi:hypothetical protein